MPGAARAYRDRGCRHYHQTKACGLAVIDHAGRRIRILADTQHPADAQTAQQVPNLLMDLGERIHRARFMIRDRDPDFTAASDAVLAGAAIRTVPCKVRAPRMNAIARTLDREGAAANSRTAPSSGTRPSAADPATARDPPQSAPAAPLPTRRRAADRTGRPDQYRVPSHSRVGGLINEYRLAA
jgi:putative transposase